MESLKRITLNPAKCGLDLGDGSERAEYVNQDYILNVLGRPHRNIGIMYTYYPKDKEWPQRISEACKDMEIHFQWDYPYDDYFPYLGGIGGSMDGEPFTFMRDIRKHGQDVALTLTIDCSLEDEYLRQIAKELITFGRMRLRINHECTGDWFTHNQRFSYQDIGDLCIVEVQLQVLIMMHLSSTRRSSRRHTKSRITGQMTVILHFITAGRLMFARKAETAMQ